MSPRIPIRLLAGQSDQRLVALVEQGHERAFEALVHRYRRPLMRYCRRMGLSDSRAEDVIQQSLLKAWQALSEGCGVRELRPWLYRIVHNAAVNAVSRGPEPHVQLTDALQSAVAPALDAEPGARMAVRDTLGHVARLPEMQRDAIVLSAIEGRDHEEVASVLGVSNGAVRGLLYRARSTLRSAAAALTPQGLLGWIGRGEAMPAAERPAELAAGAGAAGAASAAIKGALVAASAGVLATGAAVVHSSSHGSHHAYPAHVAGPRASAAVGPVTAPAAPTSSDGRVAGRPRSTGPGTAVHHRRPAAWGHGRTSPSRALLRQPTDLVRSQAKDGHGSGDLSTGVRDGGRRTGTRDTEGSSRDGGQATNRSGERGSGGEAVPVKDASSRDGGATKSSDGSGDGGAAEQPQTSGEGSGDGSASPSPEPLHD